MADKLTPGDDTVPLHGSAEPVPDLWTPGPRLTARSPGTPPRPTSRRGGSGWFVAALIIATAIVIAGALWFAATTSDDEAGAHALTVAMSFA